MYCTVLLCLLATHSRVPSNVSALGLWRNDNFKPTSTAPVATSLPAASGQQLIIVTVSHEYEYVDIQNQGSESVNLRGFILLSENGLQKCRLRGFIRPNQILRVWALAVDGIQEGFNCGFHNNIWRNIEPDSAVLYNPDGIEISRLE